MSNSSGITSAKPVSARGALISNDNHGSSHLFGVKLNDVMARPSQKSIPTVIRELFVFLQKFGLHQEGLFRNSPPMDQILNIKALIDTDGSAESTICSLDPHMAASLIKLYFKELPDALFTSDLHNEFVSNSENVSIIRTLVQTELPIHNKKLAEVLFLFLGMVLDNIHMNKMSPNEIAMIFGSILLKPKTETLESMMDLPKRAQCVLTMIYNADKIFPPSVVVRSIIKKHDAPEISSQRETVEKCKITLKDHIHSVAKQLTELKKDLEEAQSMQDIVLLTKTLKTLHSVFETYSQTKEQLQQKENQDSHAVYKPKNIPSFTCTTLLESGHTSLQGPRPTMEDCVEMYDDLNQQFEILSPQINRSFYAVFDGHAGPEVAEMASTIMAQYIITDPAFADDNVLEAMRNGLIKADAKIVDTANQNGWAAGSTAVIAMIIGEKLYSCNLGDSEAVVGQKKGSSRIAIPITDKHKPSDDKERDRILALGAAVFRGRIFGKLAVSRALGDAEYKIPKAKANYVSCEGYVSCLELTEEHEFIILACDGLWDKLSHQEAVDFVHEHLALGQDCQRISAELAQNALDKGSKDNVTVVIVLLKWRPVQSR